ncbi:breast cancer type 2 susceptibility protein isoform X1 [Danio rerio]|uniref:BRCA2 DNA repair-associated n=1 Tax=Danio rerio TaxID=7955 RepID=A0A8M2B481_DANRE|nr:breast cancer type 2 susceptibility protein [Danio rerio]XP_005157420.1 breast cancer type 2 susceptibility protein isoform X1 [Danio rerio]|eukprot:NP_001103864.2 breast cancer type 2 susceptibility protein [Danio rerio]
MFENFFHQIDRELGPLNPDWFEELNERASRDEGSAESSKAGENESIKAPETSALASQLFSTPRIFKQRHFPQSPDSIPNEKSQNEGANGELSAFPWTESSPCLFGSAKDSPKFDRSSEKPRDCFGLLDTPKRSLARSAKQISESLGAQINPDLSWTSSFNTPPSMTPTVILPTTEDRVASASILKDKESIFVRKLFPSLSKDSENATTLKQDVVTKSESIEADDLGEKTVCSPNESLDISSLWKQRVPNAIEDGDVRNTVQNVLDGAEDVLSIFFSNNTSALRKIKSKERIRKRITNSSEDVKSVFLTSEPEQKLKADTETKSPSKNDDSIEWTPLSLSETILTEGCSSTSLVDNNNTVAPSETNDGAIFKFTSESSQTCPQSVRLESSPEGTQCQKILLDKSSAFMLNKKPRKFVYQVSSSEMSTTLTGSKADLPKCLDQTLKEGPSVEELSVCLNKSSFTNENPIGDQTQPQAVEQLSSEHLDHGLDMTQLSKAFAEEFTQEIMAGGLLDMPVQSNQKVQVQPKAEPESKNKDGNHTDISNLADISVNSPNKSTSITTFEISHDSGCPTTFSDLDRTTASFADIGEYFPTFKTANNKFICIPTEAIVKAKASLDEAAGDGLAKTSNQTKPKHFHVTETMCKSVSRSIPAPRPPVGQSIPSNHASGVSVSDASKTDSPKGFKMNFSNCSLPQSDESDCKTSSKTIITVSDAGLQTESLLKEKLGRSSESSKPIHQKVDFERSAERHAVFDISSTQKPTAVDSSCDDLEENGTLTASQKADVTELCSLLEEANSQYEFTQYKSTNIGSHNRTTEKEWDPDILNDIDFDDSFSCDVVKGKHPSKTNASSVNTSDLISFRSDLKEKQNGTVVLSVTEESALVDGMRSILSKSSDNSHFHTFGFKTAKGKAISVSEKSLNKAKHFFEEDYKEATFTGVINQEHFKTESSVKTCISTENNNAQTKQDVRLSCGEVNAAHNMINWQEAGNAGTEPNCLRDKTDVVCVDSNIHFGFSTARGAKLKVSEKALEQARMFLNDVDSIGESQTPKLVPRSSGKHDVSMQSTRLQKTKDLCRGETSIKISQPDSGVANQISNGADITTFNSENVFQEQKSGNAAKEVCEKISPSETSMPQPQQGYGFQTASGKGVSVLPSALKKAKAIFKDCDSNIDNLQSTNMEERKTKLDVEIVKQTNALISNSKSVTFSDVEEFKTDLINNLDQEAPQKEVCELKGLQSEFSNLISSNGNCGFSTASGKKVSVSAEALQRAKDVLFESVDGFSCANVYKKTNQVVDIQLDSSSSGKHKGFCTAGGKKVAFSATGLQKAKNLFRGCEEESLTTEQNCKGLSNVLMLACNGVSLIPEPGNSSGNNVGFSTAGGRKMDISVTALQKANNLFKDCEEESLASRSLAHQGFTTASGKNVFVSEKALSEVRAVFAGCDETSFSLELKKLSVNNVGFSTAGGKKVTISDTSLQRTMNLFQDCEEESLGSRSLKHQGCKGFTTASGKNVTVSEKALSEVRAVFAGCDEASFSHEPKNISGNKIGFSTTVEKMTTALEMPNNNNNFKDCEEESLASRNLMHQACKGFTTASGKNVTVSETALNEVKAVFAGCDEATFDLEPKKSLGSNIGFSTAGGKKVTISSTALQRAQTLFKDCEEEKEVFESEKAPLPTKSFHARSEDIVDGNLKFDQTNKKNPRLSTASGKVVSVTKVSLEETSTFFREFDNQNTATDNQLLLRDSSKHYPQHKDRQTKATLHPKAARNEPAHLDLHSLDFNSCTDTQQIYFEQEAMACTKALLEDDDLIESAGLISSEDIDNKRRPSFSDVQTIESVDQNRKRKRQVDGSSVADSGQPPLKRQLLSEFDRTLHAKTSGLTPLKSCPNGTLKDRRVFKYNVHLKPYVTSPVLFPVNQQSNNIEEHCSTESVQKRCNSDHMGGVFNPPFQKNMNPPTSNSQDASKVSSGIVLSFNVVNQEENPNSKEMDQIMAISKSHCDRGKQNCNEKNQDSKSKSSSSVQSIPLKIGNFDEKDMIALQESLQLARDMQDMRLRKKKRQTIRPVPGSLYLAKTSGVSRKSLRDAVGCTCPSQYTQDELSQHGVHHKVLEITSENAESFRFDCSDYFTCEHLMESGALQLADGGWLVPDSKGTVGKEEFFSALCDTPGVDPKLISDVWVFNHYRWIIWKRASMERTFPNLIGGLCLTPEQVLLQLKFRYDVEVDHSQRSALRRIMERDDTPAKTLVLCVCGIVQTCQNPEKTMKDDKSPSAKMESCVIWLTDGWYSIKSLLDPPLSAMLNKGRLKIGDKIVTSGAELVGSQEACPPLEAPESLMLKISANSTRRARWDTKLGYYRDPRPIRLLLSSLYASGGLVSCVNLLVLRSYPTQWMEKKPNSVFIFRNDRAEDREARKHSNSKHKSLDLLISKIQTQFEKEMEGKKKKRAQRRTFSRHEIETLQDGDELYEAMEQDAAVETRLSHKQMEAVSKYRCCREEKRQAELQERVQKAVMEAQEAEGGCPNRDVTPVWKLSVIDASDMQSNCVYTLNIWRPTRELQGLLTEGHRYRAYHLASSEGKKRSGVAHIQLTATKKTLFQDIEVSPEWLHQHFRARECVRFRELQNPHFSSPCGEVDIVGYIVSIEGKQGHCPVLHLVDENFDLVTVRTYSSLEQLAVEELVKPRALVAICNLQVRVLSGPVPSLYAGEQALFSINPKESYLQEAMAHLKTFAQNYEQFFNLAEEKVSDVVPSGVLGSFQSPRTPGVQPFPKMNGTVTPQQKSSIFSPFTPLNRRTPASTSNSEVKDSKNLKRRRGLDYLSRIPSPPPLIPLKTRASPCINKTFNPPRKSVTPKPPQNECSPASRPPAGEEKWVHDEELAMIDTQALVDGLMND